MYVILFIITYASFSKYICTNSVCLPSSIDSCENYSAISLNRTHSNISISRALNTLGWLVGGLLDFSPADPEWLKLICLVSELVLSNFALFCSYDPDSLSYFSYDSWSLAKSMLAFTSSNRGCEGS